MPAEVLDALARPYPLAVRPELGWGGACRGLERIDAHRNMTAIKADDAGQGKRITWEISPVASVAAKAGKKWRQSRMESTLPLSEGRLYGGDDAR